MTTTATTKLRMLPEVADELGVPVHRIKYAVLSRRIDPATRAGRVRLFGDAQVKQIRAALAAQSRRA